MNRRQKIIVSITGIFIVLLALIGLTYAYFLTKITGNPTSASISVTTANLALEYEEGTPVVLSGVKIVPDTILGKKTFAVTNKGDAKVEDYGVYLVEVINTMKYQSDVQIRMTCTTYATTVYNANKSNIQAGTTTGIANLGSCNGYNSQFPGSNSLLTTNSINVGETQVYSLEVEYLETGENQTDDMGKELSGMLHIANQADIVDLEGTVSGASTGDYVQINSTQRISKIVDGKYKLAGIEAGTHTLKVMGSNGSPKGTISISIKKGKTPSVNGTTIIIDDYSQTATVNITSVSTALGITGTGIKDGNPFAEGTLAYNIYKNAKDKTNGTILTNRPLTSPAKEISSVNNYKTTGEEAKYIKSMSGISSHTTNTWYYYDTYEINETTGKFTLSGKHSCTYSSCYANLINKYLYSASASSNTSANNHTTNTKTGLSKVYKVTEATYTTLNYVAVFNSPNEAERVLAPTIDDFGTGISYYYRGDIRDNYVNFAGLCWRIVRIEGDGSVKMILEDAYAECNDTIDNDGTGTTDYAYTGNWSDGNSYLFGFDNSTGGFKLNFLNYTGGLADSFKTFQTSLATKISEKYKDESLSDKLKIDEWCYDDTVTETSDSFEYYGAYTRIYTNKKPSLQCTGKKLKNFKDGTDMYVSTLTADEIAFAGAKLSPKFAGASSSLSSPNYNYYLMNGFSKSDNSFWSLSPSYFDGRVNEDSVLLLHSEGDLPYDYVYMSSKSRPAVTLKIDISASGEGTIDNPYVIE